MASRWRELKLRVQCGVENLDRNSPCAPLTSHPDQRDHSNQTAGRFPLLPGPDTGPGR